jgi:hypothetical protein
MLMTEAMMLDRDARGRKTDRMFSRPLESRCYCRQHSYVQRKLSHLGHQYGDRAESEDLGLVL